MEIAALQKLHDILLLTANLENHKNHLSKLYQETKKELWHHCDMHGSKRVLSYTCMVQELWYTLRMNYHTFIKSVLSIYS